MDSTKGEVKSSTNKESSQKRQGYDKEALKRRLRILGHNAEQNILSLIRLACTNTFAREDFGSTLQTIKAGFVQRDYEGIFTDAENLDVYSAAYVPGRALCYYEIFCRPQLLKLLSRRSRIYAVGSGSGSELVSISAAMTRVPAERQKVDLIMQDIGEWGDVLQTYENSIRDLWKLTPEQLCCSYEQGDVLEDSERRTELIAKADLITFMFVINELFVKKVPAMALIQSLVKTMKKGAHLLVVESAGSFSHLQVGNRTYMVYMLLDALKDLECIVAEDTRWYRYPENLKYPVDIQNMRYFIRLYKRL
ncbi:hypothetical protein EC973_001068 [Apophysomyces ossiformis]|uniref:Uncharacterized protein n=1 Tax=Apophysomyces ossiformis TaxID=679940 RepID=A0A8H7BRW6_9FUNG|nr:hypothetical protein EC973_001068 [Apophysomyces ossiformis]